VQDWLDSLDSKTRARIRIQIDKMEDGNFGDVRPVGSGVSETRINFGPGYRVYFALRGQVVHLLNGGDKSTQTADIAFAIGLWGSHAKD
jgi:putative addiction module killer protein